MKFILLGVLVLANSAAVQAVTINTGNLGGVVDHIRFPAVSEDGATSVNGWLQSDPNTFVTFQSPDLLQVENGGTSLIGIGNGGFQHLTFSMANGSTFATAVVKPETKEDGIISFNVGYIGGSSGSLLGTFPVGAHGQNFFTIQAGAGEQITSVSFSSPNGVFENSGQVRLGFQSSSPVPDGGTTIVLLGVGLATLALFRNFASSRRSD